MKSGWKPIRHRLEHAGLVGAGKTIQLLPRAAVVFLARFFGAAAALLDRRGRRVALANVECAFGERYSAKEQRRIVRQSYQHFAQTMLDLMWSVRLSAETFARYVVFENLPDPVPGESVIVACYHYSNFEWLSLGCGYTGRHATILAQEFKNSLLDPLFRGWRERSGHSFIPRTGGIARLFRILRRGGNTAMLVDLTIPAVDSAVAISCFGLQTSVTPAHAWLQQRSGAILIPAHCEPLPGGRYRIVFHPKIVPGANATLRQISQACWDSFEPIVRANPAPWLWMYKHWRYRPEMTDRKYPFYASVHERFEAMLSKK